MPIPMQIARFNRTVTNRITAPFAGRLPGFAILYHVGRASGRTFSIPINVFRDGDDYLLALTYGANTDWVKNVLAADGCEIVTRGQRIRLTNPRITTDTSRRWAPPPVRFVLGFILGAIDAPQVMRLTRVG
ncbi:MAG TPA: nitroreductase family deazaflavin-dependent oxidoreductase [Ktedonobacterales bacterium]